MRYLLVLCLVILLPHARALAGEQQQPRTLVALYDSRWESSPRTSDIHHFIEMPANHLGFSISYYDINMPLPKLDDTIAGIVIWFNSGSAVPDAVSYLTWLDDALKDGKQLIIISDAGINDTYRAKPDIMALWNDVLAHIGLHDDNTYNEITYHGSIEAIDNAMLGFEHTIGPRLPPFAGTHVIAGVGTSHLRVHMKDGPEDNSYDVLTTSPHGGYIAHGYAMLIISKSDSNDYTTDADNLTQWYVNPFLFLKTALNVKQFPVPDITTLDGRRIFYAHIDGDGWNNISEIPQYRKQFMIAAEVIEEEVIKPYNQFPFTVGVIGADVDPDCFAERDSVRVAKQLFALPNVEPSSHTYTHPLFWAFFEHYAPAMEAPLLDRYPPKPAESETLLARLRSDWQTREESAPDKAKKEKEIVLPAASVITRGTNDPSIEDELNKFYRTPRSYYCSTFSLEHEIIDSVKLVDSLSPPGKKDILIQWSGDTSPFEAALALVRKEGLLNLNGGDARFDVEHPSYSYVSPIGLKVGNEHQIYASNSNEETYTDLWTDRFFGFRDLKGTVQNTESPMRVAPFNIYFHMFSGEKQASLDAVKKNVDFARTQELNPITASHYVKIANGFFSAELFRIGDKSWRIANRGAMNTFRFDNAADASVDFATSKGILGQRYFQNNLYVASDPAATSDIIITLKANAHGNVLPRERVPYLIESSWDIQNVQRSGDKVAFDIQGYGHGVTRWRMPQSGQYTIQAKKSGASGRPLLQTTVAVNDDGVLTIPFGDLSAIEPLSIEIFPKR